jgi:hypothetical protein
MIEAIEKLADECTATLAPRVADHQDSEELLEQIAAARRRARRPSIRLCRRCNDALEGPMGFFGKKSTIEQLVSRREGIERRRDAAAAEHQRTLDARGALVASGEFEPADLATADARVDDAARLLAGHVDALSALDAQIADVQAAAALEQETRQREAAIKAIDARITAARSAAADLDAALGKFAKATVGLSILGTHAAQTAEDFRNGLLSTLCDIEREVAFARRSIAEGGPLPRPAPQPEPAAPTPIEPARETLYALEYIKWIEEGSVKTAARYSQVKLPKSLVRCALAHHLAEKFGTLRHETCVAVYGTDFSLPPRIDDPRLVDLDALVAVDEAKLITEAAA